MREFTIAEVVSAVKGRLICGSGDGSVLKVCTDSRLAKPGDLFFPLIGEKNNGHDYLAQVFERGCRSVIVSEPEKIPKRAFLSDGMQPDAILVENTTKALQDLESQAQEPTAARLPAQRSGPQAAESTSAPAAATPSERPKP